MICSRLPTLFVLAVALLSLLSGSILRGADFEHESYGASQGIPHWASSTLSSWSQRIQDLHRLVSLPEDRDLLDGAEEIRAGLEGDLAKGHYDLQAVFRFDKVQALATTSEYVFFQSRCLFVSQLMTNPENLRLGSYAVSRVRGSATALLRNSFRKHISQSNGEKCVVLEAFPGALSYYQHLGFIITGLFNEYQENIMLLSGANADVFLGASR